MMERVSSLFSFSASYFEPRGAFAPKTPQFRARNSSGHETLPVYAQVCANSQRNQTTNSTIMTNNPSQDGNTGRLSLTDWDHYLFRQQLQSILS